MMTRALALAERGLFTSTPNPRVGCVLARGSEVLGEGWHERAGEAHAEVRAIADARRRGNDPRGAVAYVTLEPCNHHGRTPPCTDALLAAGVGRVVVAMADPNPIAAHGGERLRAAGVAVEFGLLEAHARALNLGWIKRMSSGRPWVRLKIAASIDGRTALADGSSQWITDAEQRRDGHSWRARACAILTGIGTVRQDNPRLTVRDVLTPRQPLKVLLDRDAELPANARLLEGGNVLVFTASPRPAAWPASVESHALPDPNGRIDLGAMLDMLGKRGINELHVEAGARLNGALAAHGLVDEVLVYLAPCLLGDPARGILDLPAPLASLDHRYYLRDAELIQVGQGWRLRARMEPQGR
jgi:diaminohydroxyphosphoribosylaminopyrimidine deaminase/5-amino-6-(5-phosphoribosylamino)uracil reductase